VLVGVNVGVTVGVLVIVGVTVLVGVGVGEGQTPPKLSLLHCSQSKYTETIGYEDEIIASGGFIIV